MKKILIADDEESIRYTFSEFLGDAGYKVKCVETLSGCVQQLQEDKYDALFLDMFMGPDNSIDFIKDLKTIQPDCAIVVITGMLNPKAIARARKNGALDYLVKPIREQSLLFVTRKIVGEQQVIN